MSEITGGIRRILSHPVVYKGLRDVLGLNRWLRLYVAHYIRPPAGGAVLDVGCGTGEIVRYLDGVRYVGIDRHVPYIEAARANFGDRGEFIDADLADCLDRFGPIFDVVTANGLLHHLEDEEGRNLFRLARQVLKPGGRVVTVDPCFFDGQGALNRYIVANDRGRNVRRHGEYRLLAEGVFEHPRDHFWKGWTMIPFSVSIVECTLPANGEEGP